MTAKAGAQKTKAAGHPPAAVGKFNLASGSNRYPESHAADPDRVGGTAAGHGTKTGSANSTDPVDAIASNNPAGIAVDVLLRADDVMHDDSSPSRAKVLRKSFRGAEFLYTLELANGQQLLSLVPSHHDHAVGEWIGIRLDVTHLVTFAVDEAGGRRIQHPFTIPGGGDDRCNGKENSASIASGS